MWVGLRFAGQQISVLARPVQELGTVRQYERQALWERLVRLRLEARRLRDVGALAERQPVAAC
jgi:hypothetical protein